MKKMLIIVSLLILTSILFSCSGTAEPLNNKKVIPGLNFDFIPATDSTEMINHSECIITGNAKKISEDTVLYDRSKWDEDTKQKYGTINTLYTIYEITISEIYKGDYSIGDKLYLAMPYGENNEYKIVNDQFPKLDNNKDYLLFISKCVTPDIKGSYEYYKVDLPEQGCIPFDFNKKGNPDMLTYAFPDCENYIDIINLIKAKK